jgi:FtsH-binding integral membrane protein
MVSIALLLVLACSEKARRSHPTNIILLALFTCAEAFLVGMISSYWDTQVVLIAFVATAAVVVGITIAAFQTKLDVTRWTSVLFMATIILIVMTLVGIFWRNKVFHLVIAAVGALLFSVWLLFDLQMLLGGKRYELSPDEYVFAALTIYIDIVSIFLYLMQVIGISQQM